MRVGQPVRLTVEGDPTVYSGRGGRACPADRRAEPHADSSRPRSRTSAGCCGRAPSPGPRSSTEAAQPHRHGAGDGSLIVFAGVEKVLTVRERQDRRGPRAPPAAGWASTIEIVDGPQGGASRSSTNPGNLTGGQPVSGRALGPCRSSPKSASAGRFRDDDRARARRGRRSLAGSASASTASRPSTCPPSASAPSCPAPPPRRWRRRSRRSSRRQSTRIQGIHGAALDLRPRQRHRDRHVRAEPRRSTWPPRTCATRSPSPSRNLPRDIRPPIISKSRQRPGARAHAGASPATARCAS